MYLRGRSVETATIFMSLSFKFYLLQIDIHIVYIAPLEIEISQSVIHRCSKNRTSLITLELMIIHA